MREDEELAYLARTLLATRAIYTWLGEDPKAVYLLGLGRVFTVFTSCMLARCYRRRQASHRVYQVSRCLQVPATGYPSYAAATADAGNRLG